MYFWKKDLFFNNQKFIKDGDDLSCVLDSIEHDQVCLNNDGCVCAHNNQQKKCFKDKTCMLIDDSKLLFCVLVSVDITKKYDCLKKDDCVCAFQVDGQIETKKCYGEHKCLYLADKKVQCNFPELPIRVDENETCISKKRKCYIYSKDELTLKKMDTGESCKYD